MHLGMLLEINHFQHPRKGKGKTKTSDKEKKKCQTKRRSMRFIMIVKVRELVTHGRVIPPNNI